MPKISPGLTIQQANVQLEKHKKEHRTRPIVKWRGVGMELTQLKELIDKCLDLTTAEVRFEARTNVVVLVRDESRYVITDVKIVNNELVLVIDPEY